MTFPQQAELDALGKKVSDGLTKSDLEKLGKLTADKAEWQANKVKKITDIANLIKQDQVSLIALIKNGAYTTKDLKSAAVHFNLIEGAQSGNSDQSEESNAGITRTQKSGPIVFTFAKVGGFRSSLIRQDSTLPATPNESHIAFFLTQGKTKEKLLQLKEKTAENETFLKSPDGIKLINEWVNWFDVKVKSYVEKHPEKVPSKA